MVAETLVVVFTWKHTRYGLPANVADSKNNTVTTLANRLRRDGKYSFFLLN